MNKSIKSEYLPKFSLFVGIHFVILFSLYIYDEIHLNNSSNFISAIINQKSFLVLLFPIVTLIINGIIPSQMKAILVFWKIKDPLPGSIAFTRLALNDPRINLDVIKNKHSFLPTDPKEQNQLWYKLYKTHEEKITIKDSQRNYLFTRDLTAFIFLLIPICIVVNIIVGSSFNNILFLLIAMSFEYIILVISTRNYGYRFVCNVLAEESV